MLLPHDRQWLTLKLITLVQLQVIAIDRSSSYDSALNIVKTRALNI